MVTLTRSRKADRKADRKTEETPDGAGGRKPAEGSWLRTHLALVVALGVVLVAALGAGAYLLTSSSDDDLGTGVAPVRPTGHAAGATRTRTSGRPGATSTSASGATSTSTPGTTTTGTTGGTVTATRDPFVPVFDVLQPTTGTTDPTGAVPTGGPAPTGGPVPTVTATTRVTSTRTATRTVAGTSLYLGLYGWTNDGLPLFRLNDVSMSPSPGAILTDGLVYEGKYTSGSETCANVAYDYAPRSLCPGEVIKLR